jgi:hypothetical protein
MKKIMLLTLSVAVLASTSVFSNAFAQQVTAQTAAAPLTRAQVYAELVRLEQAGYSPASGDDSTYPADIQAAEAKVAAQSNEQMANAPVSPPVDTTAVGATMSGSSASGTREPMTPKMENDACVGPVSFCTLYLGG